MRPTLQELGIDRMSYADRLALAVQLWASLEEDVAKASLTDEQRVELERRITDADSNPDAGIPWALIRAEARARWQR